MCIYHGEGFDHLQNLEAFPYYITCKIHIQKKKNHHSFILGELNLSMTRYEDAIKTRSILCLK